MCKQSGEDTDSGKAGKAGGARARSIEVPRRIEIEMPEYPRLLGLLIFMHLLVQ